MRKKFLVVLLAVVAALCLCFGLAACGEEAPQGPSDNTQTETGGGNNTQGGENNNQGGGNDQGGGGEEHTHLYSDLWTADETSHWHAATCGHSDTKDKAEHTYVNGVCTTCNHAHEAHTYGTYTAVDGGHTHTCTVCHKAESGAHTYTNGVCTTCGDIAGLISFKTLTVGENRVAYGKVSNATEGFSFADEVTVTNGASYAVYTNLAQPQEIENKTVPLAVGDNTFYIFASRGSGFKIYTVTLRRRPVYTVNFATSGSAVSSQQVEEDGTIAAPAATTRTGYTFRGWKLNGEDATFPCKAEAGIFYTANYTVTFNAAFTAKEYKVTLDAKGGEVTGNEQTVTYDNFYHFPVPTRRGYSFTGWYDGETKLTNERGYSNSVWNVAESKNAEAHWTFNDELYVGQNIYDAGRVSGGGNYDLGDEVTVTATTYLGYHFLGWYDDENVRRSTDETFTYSRGVETCLIARWELDPALENLNFNSDEETCKITGVKSIDISQVTIPDYVTEIGSSAFYHCSGLTSVTFGDESQLKTIGRSAFYHCSGLTGELKIPDSVTEIGSEAFYQCSGLTSVTIESGVIGEWAFYQCSGLTSVTIESGVTEIGSDAFSTCYGLTSVTIGSGVTSIGSSAFLDCCKLIEVWNYSQLKFIEGNSGSGYIAYYAKHVYTEEIPSKQIIKDNYSFYEEGDEAYLLGYVGESTELTLPTVAPSGKNYKVYDYAFRDRGALLTSVTIGSGVISIGHDVFSGCYGLTSVTIGSGSIGDHAFYYCGGLESVTIGSGVTSIGSSAFYGCSSLTDVTFENTDNWSAGGTKLQSEDLQNKLTAVQYLRDLYSGSEWMRE